MVKSMVEALEGNKVKVSVEVEEAEFEQDLELAFKRLGKDVRLKGFRPGKVPRKVLQAHIGTGYARDEAFREALPEYYLKAVKEHEVDVISPPEIDITNGHHEGTVEFDAVVEVRPSVKIEDYSSLKLELPKFIVNDDDVHEALGHMRESSGELAAVDRVAQANDTLIIDIVTLHGGEEIAGLTAEDYAFKVGMKAVVPELDENLIGAKAGDDLKFEAGHPDEDEEELLDFTITVKEVQETVLPEFNDEWTEANSDFDNAADMKADLEERMTKVRLEQAQVARRDRAAEALISLVDQELVPEALIEMESDGRAKDMIMNLQAQGVDFEQYLQVSGQTRESTLELIRTQAVSAAKLDLALRAIAEQENLEVSEEELELEFAQAAEQVKKSPADLREEFAAAGQLGAVRFDLAKSKALDWVIEHATLVDEDGQVVDPDALESKDDETSEDEVQAADSEINTGDDE